MYNNNSDIKMKEISFLTHCTLIFQHSRHLRLHIFQSFSPFFSFRLWRKFQVGCWSICTQLAQLRHPMKNVGLLTSPSVLGTTINPTVPSLGCKEGVEPLWISGLSWRSEFVHCNVNLRWHDAKETCFFPAWFCGCVAWVIARLHNTCRNSPSIR